MVLITKYIHSVYVRALILVLFYMRYYLTGIKISLLYTKPLSFIYKKENKREYFLI